MPAILLFVSDGDEDARRFAALDDGHHWIRLGLPEIWVQKLIAPVLGCFQNRSAPFLRSVHDPVLELSGDVPQHVAADRIYFPVGVEKADHPLGLLERLDPSIQ